MIIIIIFLNNIPICQLTSMSYKDTRRELQKKTKKQGRSGKVNSIKFHKHIVAFPSGGEQPPRPSFLHRAASP